MDKQQELEKALFDMVFAYCNKDDEAPHDFEIEALKNAKRLLTDKNQKKLAKIVCEDVQMKNLSKEIDNFKKVFFEEIKSLGKFFIKEE